MTGSSNTRWQRTAKGSTCTNCRQLKLKCDAKAAFPQGCSRCKRASRTCVVDKGYQRQSNKEYLQSLEREVQVLRNQSSTASPAHACSNDDGQVESEPTGMSQLLQSGLGAPERRPVDSGHFVQILAGYAQYPKELTARVTKHFAAGIRTIEAQGLEWFQTVETADTRPPISARMSANIPYQIIWWAKHSPQIVSEPGQVISIPPIVAPIAPSNRQRVQSGQSHPAHQPQPGVFDDAVDLSFFPVGDLDFDLDFTDIHLD